MNDSILISIKKMLGLDGDYTPFDTDIVIYINSALMVLNQIGVGSPFRVSGPDETWSDFLGDRSDLESVKDLVYLRVKRIFDPPSSSAVLDEIDRQVDELQWRLNVMVD